MTGWPQVPIASLCTRVTSGGTPSRKVPSYFCDTLGHPWVKSAELRDGLVFTTDELISDEGLKNSSAKYLPTGTVLIAMYGANVGQLGQLAIDATVNQAICGLVVNEKVANARYVFFALMDQRKALVAQAKGAAQQNISAGLIKAFTIPFPPIDTQNRIAAILGAYDDLIEVNRRRVAVLEEMARGLFEEWFVRFRFPGHEGLAKKDTPEGVLPEGWSYATLGDFLTLQRGFDLPATQRTTGPYPVISASGVHGDHVESKVAGPGVVTGRSGTIGQVHLIMSDFWPLNTTLYLKEIKVAGPAFCKLLLQHLDLAKHASGSAVPTLNRNHVHGIPLPVPPLGLLERLEANLMDKFRAAHVIERQSEVLAASRDLLLPRLISGQLSIEAAERELEDAA